MRRSATKLILSATLIFAVLAGMPAPADSDFYVIPIPSMTFKGDWNISTTYAAHDVVFYDGSSWFSLVASNKGNVPSDTSVQWTILAQKGDQGPLNPNADSVDGKHASDFALSSHNHTFSNITDSIPESKIPDTITRDIELTGGLAGKANAVHSHAGEHITSGIIDEARIDQDITRNLQLAGYYTKAEVDARVNPNIITTSDSTAIGVDAYNSTSTGFCNTASGARALHSNTAGYGNTGTGYQALNLNAIGQFNTATGYMALSSNTGGSDPQLLQGHWNTATGAAALSGNETGSSNTATGVNALSGNTTGNFNTASGVNALNNNIDGHYNTASGYQALFYNIGGITDEGAALGHSNTATGASALYMNTTGYSNTASGVSALYSNTTGLFNTAVGFDALSNNSTGSGNIALGGRAGNWNGDNFTGNDNIYIGSIPQTASESNTIRIGTTTQTSTYIAGIYGKRLFGASPVYIDLNGRLGTGNAALTAPPSAATIGASVGNYTTSLEYTEEAQDMGDASGEIMQLRPVTYYLRPEYLNGSRALQYGLLAEEVAQVYPDLVQHDPNTGQPQAVNESQLNAMLLNEVQKQHKEISALKERLARLEALLKK